MVEQLKRSDVEINPEMDSRPLLNERLEEIETLKLCLDTADR
jgi:hypothetical protein